jgi:hypothetical protein
MTHNEQTRLLRRLADVLGLDPTGDPTEEEVVRAVGHLVERLSSLTENLDALKLRKPGQGPVLAAVQAARQLRAKLDSDAQLRQATREGKPEAEWEPLPAHPPPREAVPTASAPSAEHTLQIDDGPDERLSSPLTDEPEPREEGRDLGPPPVTVSPPPPPPPPERFPLAEETRYAFSDAGRVYHLVARDDHTLCGREAFGMTLASAYPPDRRFCARCKKVRMKEEAS